MSAVVSLSAAAAMASPAFAADDVIGDVDFTITNPYETVDFNNWKPYKGATHVHTVRSDGKVELDDQIENYYSKGFQALALTDHGTVNYSWTKDQTRLAIFGYQYFVHGNVDEISEKRYEEITKGLDRGGNGMTEIPLGIELNGSSTQKCHVNSYYVDCGHGDLEMGSTWPEDAVKKCEKAGGICHINHVGEWTEGKSDINTYNEKFVSDFASIFLNYKSCIGMELVNTRDNRTHNDRYLYDETLKKCAPQGVPVWGFCEDDAHYIDDADNNSQYFMLPENNAANIRTSMENGTFFACSRTSKNPWELGDGFQAVGDYPMVDNVQVDQEKDQISITAHDGDKIKMVADGNVIAEQNIETNASTKITFDLNEYEDQINSYVRIYITGHGGICYVQPFYVTKAGQTICMVRFNTPSTDTYVTVMDSNGNVITPLNSANVYQPEVGTYTYRIVRTGYVSQTGAFTITSEDIANGSQIKFDVDMEVDKSGADYSKVNALINEANKLVKSQYTTMSWYYLQESIDKVDYTLEIKDQAKVDEYAADIEKKLSELELLVKPLYVKSGSDAVIDEENKIIYGLDAGIDTLTNDIAARSTFYYVCQGFGTGSKVSVTNGNTTIDEYTLVIYGDVNGDAKIDGMDSVLIDCYNNKLFVSDAIPEFNVMAMDCNHDGSVGDKDLRLLKQAGLTDVEIKQK